MEVEKLAESLARRAGKLLKDNFAGVRSVEFKGAVDIVTEMDKKAEELIVGGILEKFPDHGILAEEGGEVIGSAPFRWIIDPLDGTTNYSHGYPVFCVSIGVEKNGEIICGVVFDPMQDEFFSASLGGGAFLNGKKISVSSTESLDTALLATGFPYDIRTNKDNNIDCFARFALKSQALRRAGAAALDLANTAAGRFDGFWELRLKPWDVAAGVLIVREAGGSVTGLSGAEFEIGDGNIVASNGLIHLEMTSVIEGF
ncbi:MAG: inositol monophosphatase [Deltaproteobacteria bacterium]|nr:inositol monophosphatase [Deltaproteobacteria bacterium]